MQKYQKWLIASVVSWIAFLTVLFGGIIKNTSIVSQYACKVDEFHVTPRFQCNTRCPIIPDENKNKHKNQNEKLKKIEFYDKPDCNELEKDILDWYDPTLCFKAKWGFEDPLCPPDSSVCYVGDKWRRKCHLSCPLAYNIHLELTVNHIGHVKKERDIGIDRKKYEFYRDKYHVGDTMTCQVMKIGNEHDVLWLDEHISSNAMEWWKWSLFVTTIMATIFTTLGTIASFIKYKNRQAEGYNPVDTENSSGLI
jgi:hypothetical protein